MPIRNPVEWGMDQVRLTEVAVESTVRSAASLREAEAGTPLAVRHIGIADLKDALRRGLDDFAAFRTDVIFIALIYPVVGLILFRAAFHEDMLALLFPLVAGFALLGPAAGLFLYEMSRRREQGMATGVTDAMSVVRSPSFAGIVAMAVILFGVFLLWLTAAQMIYYVTLGPEPPTSWSYFVRDVMTTRAGWAMIMLGCGVGFLFAAFVLAISVVTFPLLLDRHASVWTAIATSIHACVENPGPIALWGVIVAVGLVLGSIPLLLGLIVVLPVLGHATWHLYRKLVVS